MFIGYFFKRSKWLPCQVMFIHFSSKCQGNVKCSISVIYLRSPADNMQQKWTKIYKTLNRKLYTIILHNIAEILLKLVLNINQSLYCSCFRQRICIQLSLIESNRVVLKSERWLTITMNRLFRLSYTRTQLLHMSD
jgi:hypothetical protein